IPKRCKVGARLSSTGRFWITWLRSGKIVESPCSKVCLASSKFLPFFKRAANKKGR
ncbi:MAG: hypothetical protein MRECE_63c001, partial [Mycoplasmataceae bacterium CE_OT135]